MNAKKLTAERFEQLRDHIEDHHWWTETEQRQEVFDHIAALEAELAGKVEAGHELAKKRDQYRQESWLKSERIDKALIAAKAWKAAAKRRRAYSLELSATLDDAQSGHMAACARSFAANKRLSEAAELMREIEWSGDDGSCCCPVCGHRERHATDCKLAAWLRGPSSVGAPGAKALDAEPAATRTINVTSVVPVSGYDLQDLSRAAVEEHEGLFSGDSFRWHSEGEVPVWLPVPSLHRAAGAEEGVSLPITTQGADGCDSAPDGTQLQQDSSSDLPSDPSLVLTAFETKSPQLPKERSES